jgi:outer membrane lipoprotein-sorting protein
LFLKILITFIIFINFFSNLQANEKQFIIESLSKIKNFSFSFEQVSKKKIETGNCVIEFDRKLRCIYNDKLQKEIIINNKTLAILQKRYNKIYFYPVSKSVFMNILSKNQLINLIKKADLLLNKNIELVYVDENQKIITILFEKKNYELIGWLIEDEFQNEIYFSLKVENINSEIDKNYFKIPSSIKQ